MLVIGTAGHIDHGKSSIVKRLTATDPDRLPEEKERGMTIDLGFAFYQTPDNDNIAFVDVPGHERFVKNMVAGAGGIDVVMLVIAADDGWMPQSEEHFQIVRMLNVSHGFVVLNKIDMVDDELIELLQLEITEKVAGSFLENAPIIPISAETGAGFDELKAHLHTLPKKIPSRRDLGKTRLYIDRSFVRPGIGGVVTGTLRGGAVSAGQNVTVFPSLKEAKVRTLHSNNQNVSEATPGQRTAISLTGIDKEYLVRGGVLTAGIPVKQIAEQQVLALRVEMLSDAFVSLKDRREIQVIIGTTEVDGIIRMYHNEEIQPGESGLIFFKPDEPLLSLIGDRFILRLPSPMVTLGGGVVLDHMKFFPRKKHLNRFDYLSDRYPLNLETAVLSELKKQTIAKPELLLADANFSTNAVEKKVKELWQKNIIEMFEGHIYSPEFMERAIESFKSAINAFLKERSHLSGLLLEQIIDVVDMPEDKVKLFIAYLIANGGMVKNNDLYNLTGRDMTLKGVVKNAYDHIMEQLSIDPFAPPTLTKLASGGKAYKEAIRFIIDTNQVHKCGSEFLFLTDAWDEVTTFVKKVLNEKNELTVADLKQKFAFSRKFTIPVIEETDRIGLTRREGDIRVKGAKFEN